MGCSRVLTSKGSRHFAGLDVLLVMLLPALLGRCCLVLSLWPYLANRVVAIWLT